MNLATKRVIVALAAMASVGGLACASAAGQAAPVVDTAVPIIARIIKPHKASPYAKFQGTIMNATITAITVRGKDNELSVQTFSLSETAAARMQKIIDKGGYQYGDKVTVYYDPQNRKAVKITGKPSKPL